MYYSLYRNYTYLSTAEWVRGFISLLQKGWWNSPGEITQPLQGCKTRIQGQPLRPERRQGKNFIKPRKQEIILKTLCVWDQKQFEVSTDRFITQCFSPGDRILVEFNFLFLFSILFSLSLPSFLLPFLEPSLGPPSSPLFYLFIV